ncbi:HAD-IA family hydrolase [Vibrio alginolyticus]|uniref:HAD-IA family hydrolase n=1 Tax=Vibrio alginolyticus TaxID=663 RepID=UPI00211AA477|nr:HAD-IA family hydrolase [Vibrio alginolyticus]MCQ9039339.1 HAD-IA family hydrolase [Vibrio alginolyticus]
MRLDAIFFDLDDTLVATSSLADYRTSRDIQGLEENIHNSKIYKPVKWMLEKIKEKGIPLALVTNSPRWYTERVLKHHDIDMFDVTVCYDEVGAGGIKPSTKGIDLALEKLGLTSHSKVIYVGDQDTDFVAAYTAGIKPVAPSWANKNPIAQIPAAILNSEHLVDFLDDYDEISLIADRTALKRAFDFPKKQLNFLPLSVKGELVPLKKEDIKLISFGRYFSQSNTLTAQLHENHQLSKDIYAKELSKSYTIPQYYVNLLSRVVETLPTFVFGDEASHFDFVTVIPAKKGKNPRLENMLARIKGEANSKSEFIPDLFEFSAGAESLKTLGGKDRRLAELQDHMTVKPKYLEKVKGATVLVLDDVITTGATFAHAFDILDAAGASLTFGACLAKTVSIKEDAKVCPKCGRLMRVTPNKKDGIHFYGCTGFFETNNKCTYSESIKVKECPSCGDDVVRKKNRKEGTYFLACLGYSKTPQCHYTENLEEV